MKKLIVTMALAVTASSTFSADIKEADFFPAYNAWAPSESGCTLNGQNYMVGDTEQVNMQDLAKYEKITGYRAADGYAVIMLCTFLVDPSQQDYPKPELRQYVWVAYSY